MARRPGVSLCELREGKNPKFAFLWKIAGRGVGEPCPSVWSWPKREPQRGERFEIDGVDTIAIIVDRGLGVSLLPD